MAILDRRALLARCDGCDVWVEGYEMQPDTANLSAMRPVVNLWVNRWRGLKLGVKVERHSMARRESREWAEVWTVGSGTLGATATIK
jgi:hypothetical protein